MRVAFYAPLKPPDHPVPSGDRRMARAFPASCASLGHEVELAVAVPQLRPRRRPGSPAAAARSRRAGWRRAWCADTGATAGARPRLWFTYHLYHKAPDWLGPDGDRVRLGIPYVVAEASVARTPGERARGRSGYNRAAARSPRPISCSR